MNVRELRNHDGEVLTRVSEGETIVVERAGTPVATLVPIPLRRATARELVERRRRLPALDPVTLRSDIDAVMDAAL